MSLELKAPSQEEFQQWKVDPVTRVIWLGVLAKWKESLKEQWSEKVFQKETHEQTVEANAAALAQIEVLNKLIDLDVIDIEGALSETE